MQKPFVSLPGAPVGAGTGCCYSSWCRLSSSSVLCSFKCSRSLCKAVTSPDAFLYNVVAFNETCISEFQLNDLDQLTVRSGVPTWGRIKAANVHSN